MASRKHRVAALIAGGFIASWLGCSAAPEGTTSATTPTGDLVDVPRPDADTEHPTKGKVRFPSSGGCASPEDAKGESERVVHRNEAAFHAAVRALGLRLVTLKAASPTALQDAEDGPGAGEWVVQRTKGSKRILVGPSIEIGCSHATRVYFAVDPSGKIYAVREKAEQVGEEAITVCGCPTSPGGCGPAPGAMRLLYELPEGTTFAGIAEIAYPMAWPSVEYAGNSGQPCPPLPPLP